MGPETVTILAGGARWSAFHRVHVDAAFDEAVRRFRVDVAAEPGSLTTAWALRAGTPIDIMFNGDLALRGFVDRYQPRLHEHSRADISISGRSRSQDLVDYAALHETGRFESKTLLEIGQELDKCGVGIFTDQQLEPVKEYQITPGETVFRVLEKLARSQGLTLAGQADGRLKITKAGRTRHAGGLFEGQNIKAADADHNWSGRHSRIIVRGQKPDGHGAEALEIEETAEDGAVRDRPVLIIVDDDVDRRLAKKRAENHRDREAGNSLRANITVQGFRDDAGTLWTPGNLVWVESPFLSIARDMLIERASFSQSRNDGSETELSVVDPRAYGGDAGKGGQA